MSKEKSEVTVYYPQKRARTGFIKTLLILLEDVIKFRYMIFQMYKRDTIGKYKKSLLGSVWIFLSPIIGIISWILMQKTNILNPGDLDIPYPVYILIGSMMWSLFIGIFEAVSNTLAESSSFILQVSFPHEVLLVKQILQQLTTFGISFVLYVIVLLSFSYVPSWQSVFLPLVLLPMILTASALGLIVSLISIVAQDIEKGMKMIMGFLIYTTPIIYSSQVDNKYIQMMIHYNPLTYLVCSARDLVLYGTLYSVEGYLICSAFSVVFFLFTLRFFYLSETKIIEKIG